jgi:glutamate synthase (NADPH/NADH) large chain
MSKMGISTYQSYCGAQIFDAVGLRQSFVDEVLHRHRHAGRGHRPAEVATETVSATSSPSPTIRSTRTRWTSAASICLPPARRGACLDARAVVADLQHAVRGNLPEKYREFARQVNEQSER